MTAALSAAALIAAIAACAQTSSSDSFSGDEPSNGTDSDASPTNGAFAPNDASTEKTDLTNGNPLCHISNDPMVSATMGGCVPDQPYSCSGGVPDGGDASAEPPTSACRVASSDASIVAPTCEKAIGPGVDGAPCTTGADCAAGFDCVSGPDAKTTCRQYCCLGTCGDTAASSSATFCDVEQLVDVMTKAPVCVPLKPCQLLSDGECGTNETCAVVNESGDTGCVAVGTAEVGKSCDYDHCDRGLTCLGQPGNRKCQRICKIGSDTICAPQTCTSTSAFKDSSFGICQ